MCVLCPKPKIKIKENILHQVCRKNPTRIKYIKPNVTSR